MPAIGFILFAVAAGLLYIDIRIVKRDKGLAKGLTKTGEEKSAQRPSLP